MTRYLARKILIYLVTFCGRGDDRLGDPAPHAGRPDRAAALAHAGAAVVAEALTGYYTKAFGFDVPLWKQYLNFWAALFHGDLGRSIASFPTPVSELIMGALPYTLALLVPAVLLSFWAGNKVGALAARRKTLDNTVLPVGVRADRDAADVARDRARLGVREHARVASRSRARTSLALQPAWSLEFAGSFLYHWILPFSALFLVAFGGWAIGMRNMIIYELEADYSNYLAALGAPTQARPQVRLPERAAAADHGPRARARRRRRRRDRGRDRVLVSRASARSPCRRSRTATTS